MKQKGRLIIIEAGDGSGKATQAKALYEHLQREGRTVRQVSFPDYGSDGSGPVRLYLSGAFGTHPGDVDAYAASALFAVDRFASYRMKWKDDYEAGSIILADRYTTSNMVHQAVKLTDPAARDAFLDWVWDFEFRKMGLPVPDRVVFLDMDPAVAQHLIDARAQKEHTEKDIHERDAAYLAKCHEAYRLLAARYGWATVKCSKDGKPRPVGEIAADVYTAVKDVLD